MSIRRIMTVAAFAGGLGSFIATGQARGQTCGGNVGPDVVVADFNGPSNYAAVDGIDAFAIGDRSCNYGTQNLLWQANSPNHPLTAQNMHRYKVVGGAGRFEQIGQSWLKHAFAALSDNFCCDCSGAGGSVLGVGCSDIYTSSQNGMQCVTTGGLGPHFQVNAHTGAFAWPYMFRNDCASVPHTSVTRRLQAAVTDLDPAMNHGAMYFFELQYVTPDDAAARNQDNNASHRPTMIVGTSPNFNAAMSGTTQRHQPAIRAWAAIDPLVQLTDLHTPEALVGDPTGFGILGCRVTDLGGGQYRYEYAVYNMNSDRSFASFAVPSGPGVVVTNIGFHDVDYHSGDGYNSQPGAVTNFDGADWPGVHNRADVSWALIPANPVGNSNALRWGTLYNFRFDCNTAPVAGLATLGMFKPVAGLPDTMTAATQVPGPAPLCEGDITGDGAVNVDDLLAVINTWGPCAQPNNCPADIAPTGGNDVVNVDDLLAVINAWGACP